MKENKKRKKSVESKVIDSVIIISLILFSLLCLIPFLVVIAASFTDEIALMKNGYSLWPSVFSTAAYKMIFSTEQIFNSYKVSIFITVVGTALSLLTTAMLAYPLSVKTLKYRGKIAFFVFFTMLFSGGLVPTYMLISKYLGMKNSIWVMILPVLINPWNMFLLRNFFSSIPDELAESAKMDGANDALILFRIILPVSLPALATIGLFYALAYWNQWYNAMLYIDKDSLYPLQYLIMKIMRNIQFMNEMSGQIVGGIQETVPSYTSRMATAIVTVGPIILVYPFIQKYFTTGLMVGSVKG